MSKHTYEMSSDGSLIRRLASVSDDTYGKFYKNFQAAQSNLSRLLDLKRVMGADEVIKLLSVKSSLFTHRSYKYHTLQEDSDKISISLTIAKKVIPLAIDWTSGAVKDVSAQLKAMVGEIPDRIEADFHNRYERQKVCSALLIGDCGELQQNIILLLVEYQLDEEDMKNTVLFCKRERKSYRFKCKAHIYRYNSGEGVESEKDALTKK